MDVGCYLVYSTRMVVTRAPPAPSACLVDLVVMNNHKKKMAVEGLGALLRPAVQL